MTKRLLTAGLAIGFAVSLTVAAQACSMHGKKMQSTATNDTAPITTAQIPTTAPTTKKN